LSGARLGVTVLLALGLTLVRGAPAEAEQASRLERMREQAREREARARDLEREAEVSLAGLEEADRRLTEARRELRSLQRRLRVAEQGVAAARDALERSNTELARLRAELEARLVAIYKWNAVGGRGAILHAQDVQQALFARRGLARVAEHDASLFDRYVKSRAEREARREDAEVAVEELREARRAFEGQEELARRETVERRNLVSLLRSRAARESKAAAELREAAARLERALSDLPRGARAPAGRGLARGGLPWPVAGPVRAGFGRQRDPEFGTETVRNGIEIQAERGVPVRAVAPGRVLFAGWFRGYGQVVILDHGDAKLTVSGYLEEVAVEAGEEVAGGQVIGQVGDTGSLRGPGLYFELRDAGRAVDPKRWLD
jgi:septal ring factor EnvC (AmiA/AmiB activator)